MNIPELIEMIHDNFQGRDIRYVVDMLEYSHEVDTTSRPTRAYTREFNHQVKYFFSVDEILPFLLECDINSWELIEWSLPTFHVENTRTEFKIDGDTFEPVRTIQGTMTINLRRYAI